MPFDLLKLTQPFDGLDYLCRRLNQQLLIWNIELKKTQWVK